ncbi:MAG: amidophosphoribosyltransferase, partial [Pseudomonadota bacterium]
MKDIRDNCGVFGLYAEPCAGGIYQGIDLLQHRGQVYCGLATFEDGVHLVTHHGKVFQSFSESELDYLRGNWGIGHVSLKERQPMRWQSNLGEIAVAFSGNVINRDDLMREIMERRQAFIQGYDLEIIAKIIMEGKDPASGIAALADKIKGAYSLVVLTAEGIYAARDVYGFRPLIMGRGPGMFAVSSESRALSNLDLEVVRDVKPGEIILIDGQGFTTLEQLPSPRRAHCAFEWAYTASVDSIMESVWVQEARNRLGAELARRDRDNGGLSADVVAPVPMSGMGHAIGYHIESGLRYQEVFLYNRYSDRSYTQPTQAAREQVARRKLSVLRQAVQGRRIVLCDDSIVRGTQILNKVRDLKNAGAREVHVRVACPPLMYPCDFGISTRSYEELMARKFLS